MAWSIKKVRVPPIIGAPGAAVVVDVVVDFIVVVDVVVFEQALSTKATINSKLNPTHKIFLFTLFSLLNLFDRHLKIQLLDILPPLKYYFIPDYKTSSFGAGSLPFIVPLFFTFNP